MHTALTDDLTDRILADLRRANDAVARRCPGESERRQPVHTVYGGAHLFRHDTARRLGDLALAFLDEWAPGRAEFIEILHLDLDFRIDFEDGYGNRPDDEEDACAAEVARELARGLDADTLPPFTGIRIKPLSGELAARSIRTLDIVLTTLLETSGGRLPPHFVVTLPKVQTPGHVTALVELLALLEERLGLPRETLILELMIETTQSIVAPDGRIMLPLLLDAARGRCVAAHFGVYDYTAGCNVTATHQAMSHPACSFARHMMQVALGGTGVWLSDGATNVMPVGDSASVHRAMAAHFYDVQNSLRQAFYQGWDLHPAQLPTRYAAVYAFFLASLESASQRLRNFMDAAARATVHGDVFDDAATGQGLLNFFLRGVNCGAITEEEATQSGLSLDELRTRSFAGIMASRSGGASPR